MVKKPTEIEIGERLEATWAMTELAFTPVRDEDQLRFETEAHGNIVEFRNGQRILYSCDPVEWPYHVHAVIEHMLKADLTTWTGSGKDLKQIDGPPIC
jgi:hypothetical protein